MDPVPVVSRQPFATSPDVFVTAGQFVDGANANNITLATAVSNPAVNLGSGSASGTIDTTHALTPATIYTVPAGKTLTISQIILFCSVTSGYPTFAFSIQSPSGTIISSGVMGNSSSPYDLNGPWPTVPAGQAVILIVPAQSTGTGETLSVTATLFGWIA